MSRVPSARLRRFVIDRAGGRCEYCRLSHQGQEAAFHVDHVLPVSAGGATTDDNLALACVSCSLRKAARRYAVDPETSESVPLFDPRHDVWGDHFRWEGVKLVGLTGRGRATVATMAMNRPLIVAIRTEEALLGRHPPLSPPPALP